MSDTEHHGNHSSFTQDCEVASLKPKILSDSECTRSIQYMEKILLQRLLIRKELKIQSMQLRLEEQKLLIEDMNVKLKKAENNKTVSLWTKSFLTVTETLYQCFGILWGLLSRLAYHSSQVCLNEILDLRSHHLYS